MTSILRHAVCAAALLAATAAQATTYQFSYTFANGNAVTGRFDGTAYGNLITDLSNISVAVNGVAFNAYNGTMYNFYSDDWGGQANWAMATFDGSFNRLLFSTSPRQPGGGFFYGETFSLGPTRAYAEGAGVDGVLSSINTAETYSAARWSVSAVPEPATYGMLLGGLGLVGLLASRRRAA